MNARRPKELEELSKASIKRLNEYYNQMLNEEIKKYLSEVQKTYLKFCCVALHEGFEFGKGRCIQFIGNWKRLHRVSVKMETNKEQDEWLEEHLKFFKGEYPTEWIEKIEKE